MNNFNITIFAINGDPSTIISADAGCEFPAGEVLGKSGNARLVKVDNGFAVVSRPRIDGEINEGANAPEVDLAWAFA